jgi:hypothetical protein
MLYDSEERQMWLDSLNEGDYVAINYSSFGVNWVIKKIEKITPKRYITVDGNKYNSKGISTGESYHQKSLEPVTQEIKDHVLKRRLINQIEKVDLKNMSLEKLQAIYEVVKSEIETN